MSTKAELHAIVDELSEDEAGRARDLLKCMVDERGVDDATGVLQAKRGLSWYEREVGIGPSPRDRLAQLAAEQGTEPISHLEDLIGDFVPPDEDADEFNATLRQWRREGGYA